MFFTAYDIVLSCGSKRHFWLQRLTARGADNRINIEDERHAAIAEDGGGGNARDVGVVGLEALDDDLALALDRIDHQRTLATALGLHQQRHAFHRVSLGGPEIEDPAD